MKITLKNFSFVLLIILFSYFVLFPGLDGQFIFDDFLNLGDLSDINNNGYIFYIFGGISSTLGRPVSLLTFALQHNYWPGDPYPFKLVNLIIHLGNGILIWLLARLLCTNINMDSKQRNAISAVTCFLWILHPIHQSTIFYVVQRMNLLAAFFTLSGILVYFYYRNSININNYRRGIITLTISYSILLALAVLSKENGILMPLYILTIEFFIINKKIDIKRFYIWKLIFLWGPLLCLAVYLIVTFPDNLATYKSRDFTMMERLYTEPYILLDYLNKIIYPRSGVYGLLNDDYPFFKGLLNPPLAIISVITVIGLITTAIITRNKFRILSFSIIWFFSGHVLESTFLNLELYFEHRNYLPSFSIIFLIACCCYFVWKKLNHKFVGLLLAGLLAITYSGVARNEARTWESPVIQADLWYRHHPGSIRALDLKGTMYLAAGFVKQGVAVYKEFKKKYPDDLYPVIKLLFIRSCVQYEHLTQSEWNDLYDLSIKAGPQNQTFLLELDTMTTNVIEDKCTGINIENMIKLEVLLAGNPVLINYMPGLHQFAALLSAKIGEFGAAYNNIEQAVKTSPNVENMMIKYNILMKMGNRKQAGEVLDKIKKMLESNFKASMVYGSIYKKMRDTYRE